MIHFPDKMTADDFLRDYWQQKPLLMRQALSGFRSPVDQDDIAGLALEEEVESRLVMENGFHGPWQLRHGPFSEAELRSLPSDNPWTLLIQGADLWMPEVQRITNQFLFLPRWRMDDIMISVANDGGSVGPHFDYYDVFLIQAEGQRQWRIGESCDSNSPLMEGTDLKILANFHATDTWLLEPGDILYLPAGVPHWGRAVGNCMTWSLGFRAPTAAEMLDDLATEVLSRGQGLIYRDPELTLEMATDAIHPAFIAQVRELLRETLDDPQMLGEWFASYMTRPKYPNLALDDPTLVRRATLPGQGQVPSRHFEDGVDV